MERDIIIELLKKKIVFDGIEREFNIDFIQNKITAIVGPRRAGKTYYLYQLYSSLNEPKLYLNFENLYLKNIDAKDVMEILNIYEELYGYKPKYLFFDEVQEIKNWNTLLRTLIDLGFFIVITGSSSKLLSKEIATQLRGRTLTYLLLPFSFREFLIARGIEINKVNLLSRSEINNIKHSLNEYLDFGGFPEVIFNPQIRDRILENYLRDLLFMDFIERHKLENVTLAKFLFEFMRQNFASLISIVKIINFLRDKVQFSKKTIYKYLERIEDTLMFYFVESYDKNVYRKKRSPRKVYITDLGFVDSDDFGKKMENLVFLEILRQKNTFAFMEIFYYITKNKKEIDFIVKHRKKLLPIEVSYKLDEDHIKKMLKALDELNLDKGIIIVYDDEKEIKKKNKTIKVVPLWKFLINSKEYLSEYLQKIPK